MSAGIFFPEELFLVCVLFPRNSAAESWTVSNPFVSFLDRVLFHTTSLLESTDLLLSIVRNLHCFSFLCP